MVVEQNQVSKYAICLHCESFIFNIRYFVVKIIVAFVFAAIWFALEVIDQSSSMDDRSDI